MDSDAKSLVKFVLSVIATVIEQAARIAELESVVANYECVVDQTKSATRIAELETEIEQLKGMLVIKPWPTGGFCVASAHFTAKPEGGMQKFDPHGMWWWFETKDAALAAVRKAATK